MCLLSLGGKDQLDHHLQALETARVDGLVDFVWPESLVLLLATFKLSDIWSLEEASFGAKKFSVLLVADLLLLIYWTIGIFILPLRWNCRGYRVTCGDLLNVENFPWNSWHSQFLCNLIGQLITTVVVVFNIIDLRIALRVTYTIDAEVFFQVTIFHGGVRVVVRLVIKLMLHYYFWFFPQFLWLGGASVLVEHWDYLLHLGVIHRVLFLLHYSL